MQGALPPDNVQLDPPVPPARRTSPTNTGLYLLACLCARLNGFIDEAEMRARMEKTVRALEAMPKWKGASLQLVRYANAAAAAPQIRFQRG